MDHTITYKRGILLTLLAGGYMLLAFSTERTKKTYPARERSSCTCASVYAGPFIVARMDYGKTPHHPDDHPRGLVFKYPMGEAARKINLIGKYDEYSE